MKFSVPIEEKKNKQRLEFEINVLEKKLNSKCINSVRREMIAMACLCKKSR
jgi:hypothetical protein